MVRGRKRGGRTLKDVGPDQVHEMQESILVSESRCPEREMLHDRTRSLSVDEITVGEGVFEASDD